MALVLSVEKQFCVFALLNAILAAAVTKVPGAMKCTCSAGFLVAPCRWGMGRGEEKEKLREREKKVMV